MIWLYLHFPALQPDPGHPGEQQGRLLERLALRAYRRVAHVALQPPAGLVLEAGSMWRLETPERLQQSLCHDLQALGVSVQASRGQSPLAARLLAEAGGQPPKLSAEQQQERLAALPLQACGLDESSRIALARLGLRTCADLLALPTASLGRRFGTGLLHWRERLLGRSADPQDWFTPPAFFDQHQELDEDMEHLQGVRFPLARLLQALEDYCQQTQQATDELALRLHHRERPPTDLSLGSAVPEARASAWEELARLHLERVTLYAPVTAISLRCRRLLPRTAQSADLTQATATTTDEPHQLLGRLQARLGRQALYRSALRADYRPDQRNGWVPAHGRVLTSRGTTAPDDSTGHPLWLLARPQPVRRQRLQLLSGPERIQTGWWDLRGIKRDYYRARLLEHGLAWVFERPDGQWFVAGYFS